MLILQVTELPIFFQKLQNNNTDLSFSDAFEPLIKIDPVWYEQQILQFGIVVGKIKRMNDHEMFISMQ